MSSKMSKRLGVSLAFAIAVMAIPTLVTSASAATSKSRNVVNNDTVATAQDPDPFIQLMLIRDPQDLIGDYGGDSD